MKHLKILHISDLHYSASNKKEIEYIKDAILLDIETYIKENSLVPNFIVFSGDLVFKPDNDNNSTQELEDAYSFFIEPLLNKLNLSKDDIFITPGNHDVNRSVLTRGGRSGLLSYSESKETVNELIDEVLDSRTNLDHLDQFNIFIDNLKNTNEVYSNKIFTIYKKIIGKIEIGIVNLNSTILAFENDAYGKLIIGERQLKLAYEHIKDCDIKIANVHHSINWLKGFEQLLVKKFYYRNFNLVFIGHEHMEQPELVNFNDEDTLIINSASIFQGRNNINGYSLLDYSFSNNSMNIYVREYDDRENKFATISFKEENKYTYEFNILEKSKNKKNIELMLDDIKQPLQSLISKELLINTAKNENNPIEEIFVEPHIYTKSEFIDTETEQELYTINKIIHSTDRIVIKGIESSGKTTLLNYIANEYLNMNVAEFKIPILLNCSDIKDPLSDTVLFGKTIDFLRKLSVNITNKELEKLLRDGDLVFLIDNLAEDDNTMTAIKNILENIRFKNNKFIFTSREEIFNSIKNLNDTQQKNDIDIGSDVVKLHLHNLKRDKAREFFQLYFKKDNLQISEFEGIYKFISKLNIPLTIFNYTLIAHVYENQKDNFKPVNESYLLDIFMENLLEKLDISKNIYIGSMSYNLKSSYLIYIAKWMVENQTFIVEKYKLQELTTKFIQDLKREKEGISIESFIEYMESKGIFVSLDSGSKYRFRYRVFLEFFIAKGMNKDEILKQTIINEDNYLNYKNEIRYYSGLHGEDEKLVIHFNGILNNYKKYFDDIDKNYGSKIYVPDIDIEDDETVSVEQISYENKDMILEARSSSIQGHNDTKIIKEHKKDNYALDKKLFQTNMLLSSIIRNSEQLRNPELKVETLSLVTNNLSKFFQNSLNKIHEDEESFLAFIETEENTENFTKEDIQEFVSLISMLLSQAFMGIAHNNLASDSLFTIYDEILNNTDDNVLKLLIVSTFIYSEDYKAVNLISKLIDDKTFAKNKFLMMALFFKIHSAIKIRDVNSKYKNKFENLLTDITMSLKYNELSHKSSVKKKLIEGNKKIIKEKIRKSIEEADK